MPTASGFPTPGANAGSTTSRSILTYNSSNVDIESFNCLHALPSLISLSEIELILFFVKNSNSSFTNERAPTCTILSAPRFSTIRLRYAA